MKAVYWALVTMLVILGILVIVDIAVQLRQNRTQAVCHALTEDSDITDCDYHNGAWWTK